MDTEGRIERVVDIYVSADAVRDLKHKKDTKDFDKVKKQTPQQTANYLVKIRSSRAAQVCLVLLCFLLLTAVIVLSVYIYTNNTNYTQDRRQLLTNITNLTEHRKELLTRNTNLTEERRQLLIQNENLTTERKLLIFQNNNLTKEREQLKSVLLILGGWTYYQYSLYFISTETKKWSESRQDCLNRKADLVIINSKVEQDFVKDIAAGANVWIGLTDSEVEGTWKWVDGTTMKPGFSSWASGEPNSWGGTNEDCALTSSNGWADFPCEHTDKYLCEKIIFK